MRHTGKNCKDKYSDFRHRTCKTYRDICNASGGTRKKLNNTQLKLVKGLLQRKSPILFGIRGGVDSGVKVGVCLCV